jgi:hypothetical protein
VSRGPFGFWFLVSGFWTLLFQLFLRIHLSRRAVFGGVADFFDGFFFDLRRAVVPVGADVGGEVGDVLVLDGGVLSEARHDTEWGVGFAIEFDGAAEAVEEDSDESLWIAIHPIGLIELWAEVFKSCAIGTVATDTSGGGGEKGFATFEGCEVIAFE